MHFISDDFLYTSIESAILTSPTFHHVNSVLCMQMIIGLCTECDAYVVILDNSNFEVIENVTAKSSLMAAHNLPMWHFITLNKTLPTDSYRDVKIQVIPKLHAPSRNPLWAIADVRQCSEKGVNISYLLSSYRVSNMIKIRYVFTHKRLRIQSSKSIVNFFVIICFFFFFMFM